MSYRDEWPRVGDTVWLAYTAFGKWPKIQETKVKNAGPQQIRTMCGNWDRGSAALCRTKKQALSQLLVVLNRKRNEVRADLEEVEKQIVEANKQFEGEP